MQITLNTLNLADAQRILILLALVETDHNASAAAKLLHIHRDTVRIRAIRLGLPYGDLPALQRLARRAR